MSLCFYKWLHAACFRSMGSERVEMRKRQMQVHQEAAASVLQARHRMGNTPTTNASNACCFCWCCCCSCSCLTVRSEDETIQRSTFEHRTEGITNCEESPKPSLEDARSWTMSFEKVMKSAAGRGCFRQFLRTEFSEENMMFWLACEELKKETNKTVVEEKVRQIYEDFISILSPKEVSLDSRVRDVINRNMLEPTSHTFDDAQQQIYTLMQRDSYPRFINSTAYTDLLKSLEEPPPEP
ncbi:regulator of G-protein signaling 20-like isoform X2 [Seriola lalandi dorsalis]|uniref:regulator of G-protein signaling 20-like isoform X2 n=1 Tax=Seriola lalandi dorsalis TaxID=1841481 RepID=UPI000C6FA0E3|nr:regulator of G-protein signaling 20-like isoform X2 [Seriola lalandi dorsalis]XP_056220186.1 regulator of G-protein signaling 20 isoform X1 [Seriola aureovittata]